MTTRRPIGLPGLGEVSPAGGVPPCFDEVSPAAGLDSSRGSASLAGGLDPDRTSLFYAMGGLTGWQARTNRCNMQPVGPTPTEVDLPSSDAFYLDLDPHMGPNRNK